MSSIPAYQITEVDYINAQRLYRRRGSRWGYAVRWIVVLIGLAMAALGLYAHVWWLAILAIPYASMPWWLHWLVNEPLARRQYRKYPAMHKPQSLEVSDENVRLSSVIGDSTLPWNLIIRWAEDDEYLLLFVQPRLYFIVPKRADVGGQVIARLGGLLARNVGPAR